MDQKLSTFFSVENILPTCLTVPNTMLCTRTTPRATTMAVRAAPSAASNSGGYREQADGGKTDLFVHFRKNGGAWETPPLSKLHGLRSGPMEWGTGQEFTDLTFGQPSSSDQIDFGNVTSTMSRSPSTTCRHSSPTRSTWRQSPMIILRRQRTIRRSTRIVLFTPTHSLPR